MVRPLRIEYPNACYHITCRGNQRVNIFKDNKDRKRFLNILAESLKVFRVEVHCYILMSNHFHFILKTLEANLGRFMQRFNTAYITYYNLRHQRSGHLYQGRYKALLVEADEYLLELSRYIHLNPVRVEKYRSFSIEEKARLLKGYRWSSLPGYIGLRERDDFMHYDMVLGYMGGDTKAGRAWYRDFVLQGLEDELRNPLQEARANAILGSDNFVVWLKDQFLKGKDLPPRDFTHLKKIYEGVPVKNIAEAVAAEYGIEPKDIIRKRSKFREARQLLVEICYRLNYRKKSLREIGRELGGVSGEQITQVHNLIRARLKKSRKLETRLEGIINGLPT